MVVIRDFEQYLNEVLNLKIKAMPWKGEEDLPVFLRASYFFYEVFLLGTPCLVLVLRGSDEITPATVEKHLIQVQKKWDGLCIYVCKTVSSYNRKRLIERHIPFVVPGNQSYLPDLGIDLREHFRTHRRADKLFLSPATQSIVIQGLMCEDVKEWTPSRLAKELNYSIMTMSRAFDELESMGIGEFLQKGRERCLSFPRGKKGTWDQVKFLMQSPVKKRIWLKLDSEGINQIKRLGVLSGLSALAHVSMLSNPSHLVYAVSIENWKAIKVKRAIEELPYPEEADIEIEVWSYNPTLFAKEKIIDPFSLYMILHESEDERIEAELEKFMRKIILPSA